MALRDSANYNLVLQKKAKTLILSSLNKWNKITKFIIQSYYMCNLSSLKRPRGGGGVNVNA